MIFCKRAAAPTQRPPLAPIYPRPPPAPWAPLYPPRAPQMVVLETVVSGFVDEFPCLGRSGAVRLLTTLAVGVTFMLVGLPCTTQVAPPCPPPPAALPAPRPAPLACVLARLTHRTSAHPTRRRLTSSERFPVRLPGGVSGCTGAAICWCVCLRVFLVLVFSFSLRLGASMSVCLQSVRLSCLSVCRPVALSPCRPVTLSPCRPVALSPCRCV